MEKYGENKKKIFVDADACPVKEEIVRLANTYQMEVVFVASYAHMVSYDIGGKWVYVDSDKEAVDLYIMNHATRGDVAITQDIGLASILVKRQVTSISPRGKHYLEKDMEAVLHLRYLSAKERRSGTHSKGPKPFTEDDRKNFITSLEEICRNLQDLRR